jgi:nucleotide-binding universal stress UspA family protein
MGELYVEGDEAGDALAAALVSEPRRLAVGRAQYSMMCAPDGGIIDDLIVYRLGVSRFLVVANAGNSSTVSDALAERIRGTSAHVVFTAHSLPARILDESDPYQEQLLETSRLVADRAGIRDWTFSFQSESPTGEPWLGPDILDHLDDLQTQGVRAVLVCPVGFVADHLEIRWDLDTEAKDKARELGMTLERIEMPNDDPAFISMLAGIVRRSLLKAPV